MRGGYQLEDGRISGLSDLCCGRVLRLQVYEDMDTVKIRLVSTSNETLLMSVTPP